jgi:hypothetical protein
VISPDQIQQMLHLFETSQVDAVVTVEPGGESDLRVTVAGDRVAGSNRASFDPVLAYNMILRRPLLEALGRWSAGRTDLAFARAVDHLAPRHTILVADVGRIANVNRPDDLAAAATVPSPEQPTVAV